MTITHKEIIIIGGGLAGLSLSILCARSGFAVLVLEKADYPRQKVCGEYISQESLPFLEDLGIPIQEMSLPFINEFKLTSRHGISGSCSLTPGGIGLSRFTLDKLLFDLAVKAGVEIKTNYKVNDITFVNNQYVINQSLADGFSCNLAVGSYGRVSGLSGANKNSQNYIGVKYHVSEGPADNVIEIHHFRGGYCGISKVENDAYCLCYLAKASDFKKSGGDIANFEKRVLSENGYLQKHLSVKRLETKETTSNFTFGINARTNEIDYPLLGDASGFIPPLTGNGMSLAFRSAKTFHEHLLQNFRKGKREQLLQANQTYIQGYLKKRIDKGILLQNILLANIPLFQPVLLGAVCMFPGLLKTMSKQAVGEEI